MNEEIDYKIKEKIDIYYDNIIDFAKNYKQGDEFKNTKSYADGFQQIALLLRKKYENKYSIKYDFMQGRATAVEPKIFIKSNNGDKNTARDGIYIYIVFSTIDKTLNISLEIGKDNRYDKKSNLFLENIRKFQNKYQNTLNNLKDNLTLLGKYEVLADKACIFQIKIKDIKSITLFIDKFADIYDNIIGDVKKYQLEEKIWGKNWEYFQKDIFQDTYIENKKENSSKNRSENNLHKADSDKIVNKVTGAYNRIFYGIPGCGKSNYIKDKYNLEKNNNYTRTTFHPDYTNSDFVGQIIPKRDKLDDSKIIYDFEPGPFTIALYNALNNSNKEYYLIIEEINRGNASAIFGDIFQILDRNEEGESEYRIDNYSVIKYLKDKGIKDIEKVYLPSNLWLIATMNTCDQNVYTLDTAFKRRWELRHVPNEFKNKKYDNELKAMFIPFKNSTITWETFIYCINNAILDKNIGGFNSEDKQIGVYFVNKNELLTNEELQNDKIITQKKEAFGEKMLLYIWEDIAKNKTNLWFKNEYKTLAKLLKDFNEKGLEVFDIKFSGINKNEQKN